MEETESCAGTTARGGADEVGGGPARTGERRCRAGKGGGGARQTWALPERDEQGANGEARGVRQCREGQPVAWPRGSGEARSTRRAARAPVRAMATAGSTSGTSCSTKLRGEGRQWRIVGMGRRRGRRGREPAGLTDGACRGQRGGPGSSLRGSQRCRVAGVAWLCIDDEDDPAVLLGGSARRGELGGHGYGKRQRWRRSRKRGGGSQRRG